MSVLLDTNVLLEVTKSAPDARVLDWLDSQPPTSMYVSVLTLGELRQGVERHDAGRRQDQLRRWLEEDLSVEFRKRTLLIDARIADTWGRLLAAQVRIGRPRPGIDALIAATADVHGLALVTRNTGDFAHLGIEIINPWVGS